MNDFPTPKLIRTTPDNQFAHTTMTHRLPANITNVLAAHPYYPDSIRRNLSNLAEAISGNERMVPPSLPAWDFDLWKLEYNTHEGESWHDTEWFFGETWGFRLLLNAVRYFETRIDPYGPMKQAELDSGAPFLPITRFLGTGCIGASVLERLKRVGDSDYPPRNCNALSPEDRIALEDAFHLSMWGNRADISFAAGAALDHSEGDRDLLLVNEGGRAAEILLSDPVSDHGDTVHIIMDNSGAELAGDLVLALAVIALTGHTVVLHPKMYPTYVSDTTVEDIHIYLDAAAQWPDTVVRETARAVRHAFDAGRITIAPDDFWCRTRFLAEMPGRIAAVLEKAALVIVKGDLNYRRVFRDTIWTPDVSTGSAVGRALSFPVLLLRTMKSDCLVGVAPETREKLDRDEPGWRTAGRRGLIQMVEVNG